VPYSAGRYATGKTLSPPRSHPALPRPRLRPGRGERSLNTAKRADNSAACTGQHVFDGRSNQILVLNDQYAFAARVEGFMPGPFPNDSRWSAFEAAYRPEGRAQMRAAPAIPRKVTTILLAGGSVTVDASSYLALKLNRFSRAAVKGRGRLIITSTRDLPPRSLGKIFKTGAGYVAFRR
jgi:hypothetical protein